MGLSTRAGQARTALVKLGNQQLAELAGVNYAGHLVTNQRWQKRQSRDRQHGCNLLYKKIEASPKHPNKQKQTRGYSRAQRLGLAVRNRAPSSQPAVRNRALPLHLAVRNRAFIFLG